MEFLGGDKELEKGMWSANTQMGTTQQMREPHVIVSGSVDIDA